MMRSRSPSSRRRASSLALLLAVLVCGAANLSLGGGGKVLRVWCDEFEPSNSAQAALQSPGAIRPLYALGAPGAPFTNVNFHKVLDLRAGKEISGVTYFHSGSGANPYTVVSLLRLSPGGKPVVLATGGSTAVTQGPMGVDIVPVDLALVSQDLVVHKDDRYYLTVNVDNSDASVHGVEVFFQ